MSKTGNRGDKGTVVGVSWCGLWLHCRGGGGALGSRGSARVAGGAVAATQ